MGKKPLEFQKQARKWRNCAFVFGCPWDFGNFFYKKDGEQTSGPSRPIPKRRVITFKSEDSPGVDLRGLRDE